MRTKTVVAAFSAFFALALTTSTALAHHSFAIYDFKTEVPFEGVVDTIKFKNPHISMTLKVKGADGKQQVVDFVEGAPANMLVRNGLRPEMIAPGTHINVVGSPLLEDRNKFFIRIIKLDDGQEFKN